MRPKQQKWNSKLNAILVKARPELSGRVDWDTAAHLFHTGCAPSEAAELMLSASE